MWIGFSILVIFMLWGGYQLAKIQNHAIDICLDTKLLHNQLLTGVVKISDCTDKQLLRLKTPMFTHVGLGGIGPSFAADYSVLVMIIDELKSRETNEEK